MDEKTELIEGSTVYMSFIYFNNLKSPERSWQGTKRREKSQNWGKKEDRPQGGALAFGTKNGSVDKELSQTGLRTMGAVDQGGGGVRKRGKHFTPKERRGNQNVHCYLCQSKGNDHRRRSTCNDFGPCGGGEEIGTGKFESWSGKGCQGKEKELYGEMASQIRREVTEKNGTWVSETNGTGLRREHRIAYREAGTGR